MLVLFETAAGYALFKVLKEDKLKEPDELWKEFETPEKAKKTVELINFQKFNNMSEAVSSIGDLLEGKLSKDLKNFLKETFEDAKLSSEELAVIDQKIGTSISNKLGIQVVSDKIVTELYRGIKLQLDSLISDMKSDDINHMALGLSHSLSRHKLKFSPDKVDNMIIQAIGLLDDLDKELNTYAMRVKEWYGWHFPEMSKIVVDNLAYAKVIKAMGLRSNAQTTDFSEILPEDLDKELKEAAEISMGSEISEEDIDNIIMGCEQVIGLTEYRAELYEYLKNRMLAIAPNLTTLVGELVGARLIAHSGSLLNLAKHPASTIQILGAEKALFRALKTKNPTPKYGLIYNASLVGQATPKNKGKVARLVATKSSLATRFDALSEEKDIQAEWGHSNRKYIESRIRSLEGRNGGTEIKKEKDKGKQQKKSMLVPAVPSYNSSADVAGSSEYGIAGSSKLAEYGIAGSSKSAEASTAGIKRKSEVVEEENEEESSESEEESEKSESSEDKSKDKKKKTKKQKLETKQEKERPSKETKAKEGEDKKKKEKKAKTKAKDKEEVKGKKKEKAKEKKKESDEPSISSKSQESKASKKRKKTEVKEESKSGKKVKKVKTSKESPEPESSEEEEKEKEVKKDKTKKAKQENTGKKKSDKGKQKEKVEDLAEEVVEAEKQKIKKKDKKNKKDKKDKKDK